MTKLWLVIGKILFWVGWPVSFISLYFSRRTRVLIVCGNEALLVKNWFGSGYWSTPGGGLHKGELPAEGAVRELNEELGLEVKAEELVYMYEKKAITKRHFRYYYYGFFLELARKPKLKLDKIEIADALWYEIDKIRLDYIGAQVVRDMVDAWEQQAKM